jgi:hypothetical protein
MAKYQIAFLIVVGAYFLLNGLIPRNENINWQMYSNELQQDGWTKKAADHIAKVKYKLIPEDSIYTSYMED